MYKQMIPADVVAREAQSGGPADKANNWQQLIQVMREHGFEMREDLGEPFDPKYHDAVSTRTELARPHHTILEVWQRGWLRGKDLFRPAKVVVNDLNSGFVNYVDGANIANFRKVAERCCNRE